jgi:hypothetical protein
MMYQDDEDTTEYGMERKIVFVPRPRSRINLTGICLNVLNPALLFCFLLLVISFKIHYQYPFDTWLLVALSYIIGGLLLLFGSIMKFRFAPPSWHVFAGFTVLLATVMASMIGEAIFCKFMRPYYDLLNLNEYSAVNPGKWTGEMAADAGRIYFADGTQLDVKRSMGFRHKQMYCVAPIDLIPGTPKMERYDFWAVGINCCSGPTGEFECVDPDNTHRPRSGLRSLDMEAREFYRLAVQQAEAAYGLNSPHPIFVQWVQDPVRKHEAMYIDGLYYYCVACFFFAVLMIFVVLSATFGFGRMDKTSFTPY